MRALRYARVCGLPRLAQAAPTGLCLRGRYLSQAVANTASDSEAVGLTGAASAAAAASSSSGTGSELAMPLDAAEGDEAGSTDSSSSSATSSTILAAGGKSHPSAAFRVKMMRAIKDRDFEQVLNEYDDMVEAGVAPDTLTLNCLVEAKAHSQGTLAAREALKVRAATRPGLWPAATQCDVHARDAHEYARCAAAAARIYVARFWRAPVGLAFVTICAVVHARSCSWRSTPASSRARRRTRH